MGALSALREAHERLECQHRSRSEIEGSQRENTAWALEAARDAYIFRQDELHAATTLVASAAARREAEATERRARSLNVATWVLAFATTVLAVATIYMAV